LPSSALGADLGFEVVDAGELRAARLLEPLGMLWLQLGGRDRRRDVAFVLACRELNKSQAALPSALAEAQAEAQEAG